MAEVRRPGPRSEAEEGAAHLAMLAAQGLIELPRKPGLAPLEPIVARDARLSEAVLENCR